MEKHLVFTTSSKKSIPVVVLCAGGTGLQIAESILRSSNSRVFGFLDDDSEKCAHGYHDFPILGGLKSWKDLPGECLFISSLYSPKKNPFFFELIKSLQIPEARWTTIIDPHAVVSPMATFGYGTYIGPGTVLEPKVRLGNLCAMLGNVYIAHNGRLADYVVCANSVSIAGEVSVGQATFIGANATVREHVKIGSCAVIGMGSVVLNDVADKQLVAGNPARVMSER